MKPVQAGYNILLILSIIDGDYDDAEGRVILDFIEDNYDGTFDPKVENQAIMALDDVGVMARFDEAGQAMLAQTTGEDREALLEFGLDLVMTDGELSEEENRLVQRLASSWELALQPLVARIV